LIGKDLRGEKEGENGWQQGGSNVKKGHFGTENITPLSVSLSLCLIRTCVWLGQRKTSGWKLTLLDLGSSAARHGGSTPPPRNSFSHNAFRRLDFLSEDDFSQHWILSPVRQVCQKRSFAICVKELRGFLFFSNYEIVPSFMKMAEWNLKGE